MPVGGPEGLLPIHAGAEGSEFMIEERLINPAYSLLWRLDRQRRGEIWEPQTGPWPLTRVCDESRASGIPEHIAEDGEEMAVPLNGKTLESSLPHVPMTSIMAVIPPDMTCHPPVHERTQARLRGGGHHEVKMIGHQAEAKDLERMPSVGRTE